VFIPNELRWSRLIHSTYINDALSRTIEDGEYDLVDMEITPPHSDKSFGLDREQEEEEEMNEIYSMLGLPPLPE
jgi:hypothetical protein